MTSQIRHPLLQADVTEPLDSSWGEVEYDARISNFRAFLAEATDHTVRFIGLAGDFNENGELGVADLDTLTAALRDSAPKLAFDVNRSGTLEPEDRLFWIHVLDAAFLGDSNLDGEFNSRDLVAAFQAGQYEDGVVGNSTWASGDWDGDADFTSADLVVALTDNGYEQGPRTAVASVPEPSEMALIIVAILCLSLVPRPRRRCACACFLIFVEYR